MAERDEPERSDVSVEGNILEADPLNRLKASMRQTAQSMAGQASKQLSHGVDVTTDYVKQKPLQSVAIAAGVGLLVGALLRKQ